LFVTGQFTLGEMLRWAARAPVGEIPLVDGEWFFISCFTADCCCCRERMKVAKTEDN
jgi:hypothetical protein